MSLLFGNLYRENSGWVPFECRGGVVREVDSIALRQLIDLNSENGREFFSQLRLFLTIPPVFPPQKLTALLGHP